MSGMFVAGSCNILFGWVQCSFAATYDDDDDDNSVQVYLGADSSAWEPITETAQTAHSIYK